MKHKLIALLLITTLALSGCGGSEAPAETSNETAASSSDSSSDEAESIEVDENLLTVEITIPADYAGETTQEDIDASVAENGYKSGTLNEDGSITYVMSKRQHREMMEQLHTDFTTSLSEIVGSEEYPTFTNITTNDNFTEFTITTTSTELNLNESFSVIVFYMYGGMYNAFNGTPVDNVHVDFVNAESGEIISSSDSSDMGNTESSETNAEQETADTDGVINFDGDGYNISYVKHEVSEDYEGNPCLLVYYNFTNNSEENASAMAKAYLKAFQNGIQCDTAILMEAPDSYNNSMKEIQPGITIEVCQAFCIDDTSDVTLEASDFISFDDAKDVQILVLE